MKIKFETAQVKEYRSILAGLLIVLVAGASTLFFYNLELKRQLDQDVQIADDASLIPDLSPDAEVEKVSVELFFAQGGVLPKRFGSETRLIAQSHDVEAMGRLIVLEVLKGPMSESGLIQVFSGSASLRQFYVTEADNIAVVDLSGDTARQLRGGVLAELAAIGAISRSLVHNLPEVNQVRFLVEGKGQTTLAGHVSIRHPFG